MLETILAHLNNWFVVPDGIHEGTFAVEGGGIELPSTASGQYFRVCGSVFNDGLHQYPAADLIDETFTGSIWALAVPPALVKLADEISEWTAKNQPSVYAAESFGGYSYSKAAGTNGAPLDWQDVFKARLNPYRKMPGMYGRHEIHAPRRPWNPEFPWGGGI